MKQLYYALFWHVRKNFRPWYNVRGMLMLLTPKAICRWRRRRLQAAYDHLSPEEKALVDDRVNYYCQLTKPMPLGSDAPALGQHTYANKQGGSVYFFDTYEYTRCFDDSLRWLTAPGDITCTFEHPTIAKTRPIGMGQLTTLINMDKVRHFVFFGRDPWRWSEKRDGAIFRGSCHGKPNRQRFLELYADNPRHSVRDCCNNSINKPEWRVFKPTAYYDHLRYKFIIALEGNELASNLKWVMSSNSIAVTPKMHYESWFMEGRLWGGYHYIEVADDYSDLDEKLQYYLDHPDEAQAIIQHAHEWVAQFQDKTREDMIALRTLDKYLRLTNGTPE